ncbi:MAG: helix-turn-helix domain-containing protein [Pyrinomonadaceae bacterium]
MNNDELKKRRERLGLTQAALAEKIGVVPNTVSRYETGSLEIPIHLDLVLEALEKRQIENLKQPITQIK